MSEISYPLHPLVWPLWKMLTRPALAACQLFSLKRGHTSNWKCQTFSNIYSYSAVSTCPHSLQLCRSTNSTIICVCYMYVFSILNKFKKKYLLLLLMFVLKFSVQKCTLYIVWKTASFSLLINTRRYYRC